MLVSNHRKPAWWFYPAWVVLSALSVPLAWVMTWVTMYPVVKAVGDRIQVGGQSHITEDFLLVYILFPLIGLLAGMLQYLLLRRYLPRMAWWIAATFLGWFLFSVMLGISALFSVVASPAFAPVLMGAAIIGLPQWLVLRQRVGRAALWILASVLGWVTAFLFIDGGISSQPEILIIVLLPPIVASIAWWLLLDKWQQRESKREDTPRNTSMPLGAP